MKSNIEFLYEELRKATDGGSESMTHDDALKQIAYWRDKCSQAQAVEPISPWQDRIQNKHPASDPEYWPDELIAKYARAEVDDLRREVGRLQSEAEQAQAVEPVATVQCVRGVTIGYLDVMQPVGTKLYLHPVQTPAEAQQVAAPMTEAQIFACDPVPHVMFDQQRIDFARAIEAHHGIGAKP